MSKTKNSPEIADAADVYEVAGRLDSEAHAREAVAERERHESEVLARSAFDRLREAKQLRARADRLRRLGYRMAEGSPA